MKTLVKPTKEQLAERPDAPLTADGLFADGPTVAEYVAAGYKEENYPPAGYAPRGVELKEQPQVQQSIGTTVKHYEAHNSNRAIRGDTLDFHFSPYQHLAGTWMGTYTTDKPNEIAELDKLVSGKKSGVYAMTDAEFENAMKKKALTLQNSGPSLIHSEAAVSPGQRSAKAADLPDTEPKAPEPPKLEGVETLELAETRVPETPGAEAHDAS